MERKTGNRGKGDQGGSPEQISEEPASHGGRVSTSRAPKWGELPTGAG